MTHGLKRRAFNTLFAGLVVVAMAHGSVLRADSASLRRIQFAVTVAGLAGSGETYGGFSNIGPGGRVDFNLGKRLMISPEIAWFFGEDGGLSLGGTVNYRFGKGYAGLGVVSLNKSNAIFLYDYRHAATAFWKAHAGIKGRHWLIDVSYVTINIAHLWLYGFGMTAGYIF